MYKERSFPLPSSLTGLSLMDVKQGATKKEFPELTVPGLNYSYIKQYISIPYFCNMLCWVCIPLSIYNYS